ncbi:MAG TPA: cytochrome P450 [Solirubrobacteraceae bacterium]|nr:cytochrome P450 [Solirubrobacteraceae bacterium]
MYGSGSRTSPPVFEPLELHDDPYPLYRRLRDERPAYADPDGRFWALSRHADVQAAARDWERFSSAEGNDLDDTSLLFAPAGELTHADPPLHTRLRDAIKREFGLGAVSARLEPVVRGEVRRAVAQLRDCEQIDFAEQLATALPAAVICGWLGFPKADHAELVGWFWSMLERVPGQLELPAAALQARDQMRAYIGEAMRARRTATRDDLLSVFVEAERAGALSEDEVLGSAMLLFFAGITTTSALIANSLLHLQRFESQRELLRSSPEIAPAAVEELLRFDAPLQWLTRVAACDVDVCGRTIPAGSRVLLIWASANRDERRWPSPDELILTRERLRQIAFGEGIHHCLGAPLARLEARIVLEELMPQIAEYEPAGPLTRLYTQTERTITSLPMRVRWA